MALNYVNCLPNQPVYKPQVSPNQSAAGDLSTNGRPGREAAQFPPTNIATVELLTVVTSFLAPTPTPPELRQIRPLWLKLKYFTQFMNKNNLITRYDSQVLNHFSARDL